MATETVFGVFAVYKGVGDKLEVRPPATYPTAEKALAAARTFALVLGGAVAYSKVVDTESGASEDGMIIGRFGVMADRQLAAPAA